MSDQDVYDDPELAAQEAALAEQLARLADARSDVQSQTRGLESDIGSFRAEQQLAADAAHSAAVELATSQGGDFYAPDVGQRVAPDGTVTYDFDAHLHARGVDLDAGTTTSPPSDSRVRWLRASDGALLADLFGYEGPAGAGAAVNGYQPVGVRQAQLQAAYDSVNGVAKVQASAYNPPGAQDRTIIDDRGRSHFVQLTGPAAWYVEGYFVSVPVTLTGGASAQLGPFTLGRPYTANAAVFGGLSGSFANNTRTISWSYSWIDNSQFYVELFNTWLNGTASGAWVGAVLHD
jgi:hypothetical protein